MKILCAMLLLSATAVAQQQVNIVTKSGEKLTIALADNPEIKHSGKNIVVTASKVRVTYAMSDVEYASFSDKADGIESITIDTPNGKNHEVRIYTLDGKLYRTVRNNAEGSAEVLTADLPRGSYIIKTKSETIKITKL